MQLVKLQMNTLDSILPGISQSYFQTFRAAFGHTLHPI